MVHERMNKRNRGRGRKYTGFIGSNVASNIGQFARTVIFSGSRELQLQIADSLTSKADRMYTQVSKQRCIM